MIKHKELADPNSCLNRAANDEPVFVLRANDPLAPKIVRRWADEYDRSKRLQQSGTLTEPQVRKLHEARRLADDMEEWQLIGKFQQGARS